MLHSTSLNSDFKSWPRLLERETYLQIRDRNIPKLLSLPGVLNLYTCGNIDTPGISDLDFLITVDGSQFDIKALVNLYDNFNADERYTIGCHYPFIAPAGWDEKIHEILPLSNASRWVDGSFVETNFILDKKKLLPVLAELFLNLYPQTFFISVMRRQYQVRECIMALKAFRFPLRFSRDIGEDKRVGKAFEDRLTFLKDNFFNLCRSKVEAEIIELTQEALSLSFRLLHDIGNILSRELTSHQRTQDEFADLNIVFKDLTPSQMQRSMTKIYRLTKRYVSIVPTGFRPYCYGVFPPQQSDLPCAFLERKKLIDTYAQFMSHHGMTDLIIWPPYLKKPPASRNKRIFMRLMRLMAG